MSHYTKKLRDLEIKNNENLFNTSSLPYLATSQTKVEGRLQPAPWHSGPSSTTVLCLFMLMLFLGFFRPIASSSPDGTLYPQLP